MNIILPGKIEGQLITKEGGKLVPKRDLRKGNLYDRQSFNKHPQSPDSENEAPSDGVTTMHGHSIHEKRVRASEQRDSLLESLDYQDGNRHERNLKKIFKGTCPPPKDTVTPNKKT